MLKKLSGNILIYGATNGLKSLVPFIMLPILTYYLSAADYGVLALVEVSILFLAPFITLNINSAINVEFFKLSKNELKQYITNALTLSFIAGIGILIVFTLFRTPISALLKLNGTLIVLLPVFALMRVVSSVVLGIYQVSEKPVKFAGFTLIQTIIDFTLSYVLVVYVRNGYIGRLEGIYGAFLIMSVYGIYVLYKMGYLAHIFTFKYTKDILHYGLPLIPHVLGGIILAMSDRYFISYFEGNAIVGYYTVAYQVAALMLLVSVSINQAWMPMLFKLLNDYQHNKKTISTITVYLIVLYTVCALAIYYLSDFIYSLLVHKEFYASKEFFPVLLAGFLFQSYYYLFTNFLFFLKKTALLAKLTFFSAIINIGLNYILIVKFGAIGVAYATLITYVLYFLIIAFIAIHQTKIGLVQ